jgi:hypothetical protein
MSLKKKILIGSVCFLLLALWVWFTRPISVSDRLKDRQLVQVSVSYDIITPGVTGKDTSSAISTLDPDVMREVTALMDQFPCNEKLANRYPVYTEDQNIMQVRLSYKTKDKKDGVLSYLIYSDGRIMIADWKQKFHDYGVGRFGAQKGTEYYRKMKAVFDQKKSDPAWRREAKTMGFAYRSIL